MTHSVDAALDRLHRFNPWFQGDAEPAPADGAMTRVRVSGYLRDESGWGAAGRGYVRALQRLGVPLELHDVSAMTGNRSEDRSLALDDGTAHAIAEKTPAPGINIVCVDAGQHFTLLSKVGRSYFDGQYNVGAWAWELPRFPAPWYNRFAYYDEIWVGTSFIATTLAPIAPVPVVRIPPVITPQAGDREAGRRRLGVDEREFVFTFVFDVHSHLPRKNPGAVITAFRKAFPAGRSARRAVRLVLKSVNAAADPHGYAALKALAGDAAIDFHDGYWAAEDVRALMAASDAYVSLHRSEGTGLTMAEAMALGKPVIATDWSGNTDFMDAANSYPVAYRLTTIDRNVGPYRAGETWAEADTDHAATLMRHVVDNPAGAARIGAAARQRMMRDYSEEAVAALIQSRLDVIRSRHRLGTLRSEISAFVDGYRDLVGDIREIVADVVPAGSVVAVVTRGDSDFLDLDACDAWHFPEARPGVYAGHHPADSYAAIAALEATRSRGARFLVLPGTSFWWLDHYDQFARHLSDRYACLWRDARCAVFDLRVGAGEPL